MFHERMSTVCRLSVLLLLVGFVPSVAAQTGSPPDLFLAVADPTGLALDGPGIASSAVTVLRQRVVRVDHEILATVRLRAARGYRANVLRLNLFDDVVLHSAVARTGPTSAGYWLSGRIDGSPLGSMTLVVNGDVVVGAVRVPGAAYAIRSVGSGVHAVRQLDPAALLPRQNDVLRLPAPPPEPALVQPVSLPLPLAAGPAADLLPAEDGSRIDVLVVYTPAARDAEGGHDEIEALIDLYVAETNQAYANSGVIQRLNLVLASMVDYEEARPEGGLLAGSVDLNRLVRPEDGYLDEIHDLRDRYAADIVTLVGHYTDGTGGIAASWCEGHAPSKGCAPEAWMAFNLVDHEVSSTTFAHELGHTMGLNHDRYAATRCPQCSVPPEQDLAKWEPHPYAFGYVNQRAIEELGAPESSRWFTIMAYPSQCNDAGIRCSEVLRFSNPDLSWNGDPMGVPGHEPSSSLTGPADARRTLNETRRIVANFRVGPANLPPVPVGMLPPVTITIDESAVAVDASAAFRDPDGDPLTYGAASSSSGVASVLVSGSTVMVTPVSVGASTVTVTATDTTGSNTSATQTFPVTVRGGTFTDRVLVPGESPIRAVHFTELRTRIDRLRTAAGLSGFAWTDPVLTAGVTPVRLTHLLELRSALAAAYASSGRSAPIWTDPAPERGTTVVRVAHVMELRTAVVALE